MAGTHDSRLSVAVLFPELLGTYGDGGNGVILAERLRWRGYDVELLGIEAGTPVPETCSIYLLGGGEDAPQIEAARELGQDGPLHRAVANGAVVLAVCAGMQIVGTSFPDSSGAPIPGVGLLDCATVKTSEPRAVGELLVEASGTMGLPRLTGFENHGGRTRLGAGARPLGTVTAGVGNGDGTEGVLPADAGGGKVLGTYLHGPVLARNPALADLLLAWALDVEPGSLEPVDDTEAELLRAERFRAVEAGNLEGVAHRSWRDRLLRRN